jgi:type I restriction enzyme S subunit
MMSEYPESWVTMALSDAVINVTITDKKIPQKEYLSEGAYPVFDQGQEFIGGYTDKREKLVECELPVIVFGDHTRVIKFVNQPFAAGADGVKVLQPKCFYIPRLFEYFSLHLATHLTSHGYARHYQHLAKSIIPLPPTNEQHRIVSKIEALFSALDKGIESFKTAREQLKIYRQALLKHAFSGKLTEQWRAENADKLESADALLQRIQTERQQRYQQQLKEWEAGGKQGSKPKALKTLSLLTDEELTELPVLPDGWIWVQLEYLVTGIDQGWSPKCENTPAADGEWGVIKTTAVQHCKFLEEENKSLPKDLKPREQHKLNSGDILITRAGPRVRVGVCCLVRKVRDNLMNCDKVYRIRSFEGVCRPDYIEANLNSPRILDEIEKIKSGINDSGVNLNQGAFLRLAVPYCSLTEQEFVLGELDRKLSITVQLDQNIECALQQAEALRLSILKKAFSGQLVPQDPNDEPASVLLERIQAEKAAQSAQSKPKKTPKRKATT